MNDDDDDDDDDERLALKQTSRQAVSLIRRIN